MNKYHILVNDIQKGPFSKEELKNLELSKSTLVWFRELKDWTEIQDIEELKSLIENRPPPIPKKPDKNELVKKETAKQIVNVFKLIKTSLLLGIMLLIGYAIYSNLISYSLFDKKFHASEAEKILGYLPREYVFKETSREGYFGPAYGSMVITDSGEKKSQKFNNKSTNRKYNSFYTNYDWFNICYYVSVLLHKKRRTMD